MTSSPGLSLIHILIKNTLGLASIGLTCAIIKHFGLWPENIVETMPNFIQGDTDFLSWFIAALITGSILGMNRELLIKAGIRYFVPITGGLVFAYLLGGLVGQAFGMSFKDTIFYIAGPIMGGGTGAGAVPMSEMYSEAMGPVSYTHLDVYKRQINSRAIREPTVQ